MIQPFSHILMLMSLLLAVAGCSAPAYDGFTDGDEGFYIGVQVPLKAGARADGDDPLNEFTVKQLHLYFFVAEGHDDATSEYVYEKHFDDPFVATRFLQWAFPQGANKAGGLFGASDTRCIVYAVANVDRSQLTARTIDGLKATVLTSGFAITKVQPFFSMDGTAEITLDRATRKATGQINLDRAASKLTLAINVPNSIEVSDTIVTPDGNHTITTTTYEPVFESMHVWLANGVDQSALNTEPVSVDPDFLFSNATQVEEGKGSSFTLDASQSKYRYVQNVPFYSYPNKWDPYSPDGNTYITLALPWVHAGKSTVTWYRLNVQRGTNKIERNTHYDMRISINRLGGKTIEKPVNMTIDWDYGLKWNTQTLPTDIKDVRYLLLNNNDWDNEENAYVYYMNNETEISVPFSTSHPVSIQSDTVGLSWIDYSQNTNPNTRRNITLKSKDGKFLYKSFADYTSTSDFAGIEVDNNATLLNLKRALKHLNFEVNQKNTGTDRRPVWVTDTTVTIHANYSAVCEYKFTIVLRHADDPSVTARVVIKQLPAISINADYTSEVGLRFINSYSEDPEYDYGHYEQTGSGWNLQQVWVDAKNPAPEGKAYPTTSQTEGNAGKFWLGSIHDNYAGNKHTYVISITRFEDGENYIIGDPRSKTVNNLPIDSTASKTNPASWAMADKDDEYLRYYYPADESPSKERFIAPKFRIASQWGVTYDVNREQAMRRCASYQEDGCKAGRWRLPTPAEVEYIATLSCQKQIPYLFGKAGENADYWCSTGAIEVVNNVSSPQVRPATNNTHAVRCVYDEWFWEDDRQAEGSRGSFEWGDQPR